MSPVGTHRERVADLLAEAGVESPIERTREFWLLIEGTMALLLIHGDGSYIRAAAEAARKLLIYAAQQGVTTSGSGQKAKSSH